jgi:hypothetical protein
MFNLAAVYFTIFITTLAIVCGASVPLGICIGTGVVLIVTIFSK